MQGTYFYEPSSIGYEKTIAERLAYWRSRDQEESLARRVRRYMDDSQPPDAGERGTSN